MINSARVCLRVNTKDKFLEIFENMLTVIDLKEGARRGNLEQFLENCFFHPRDILTALQIT